jgi:hypothetical protein
MRLAMWIAVGLLLPVAAFADDSAAQAVLTKALEAQGGAAKLAKLQAATAKIKGTFHGMGAALDFTGEYASQGADRYKVDIEIEVAGQKLRFVQVLSGNEGWYRYGDDTEAMDPEALAEAKEEAYAEWVSSLIPLKDKQFTLSPLGELAIEQRQTVGVKVASEGHRDVDLYFDKETGLLAKIVTQATDDGGQLVSEETLPSEYREFNGIKQPTKYSVKRDGKLYMETEVTEIQLVEKLDDSVFAKP